MKNTKKHKLGIPFTQVSNILLNDKNISLKAKGLFAFMYSKPINWNFTIKSMASQLKEGEDAIKKGLQELKDNKYIEYTKNNDGTGVYELIHNPKVENPHEDNPYQGKSTRISNTYCSSKKEERDDGSQVHLVSLDVDFSSTKDMTIHKPRKVAMDIEKSFELDNDEVKLIVSKFIEYRDFMYSETKDKKYALKTTNAISLFMKNTNDIKDIVRVFETMELNEWATFKKEWVKGIK